MIRTLLWLLMAAVVPALIAGGAEAETYQGKSASKAAAAKEPNPPGVPKDAVRIGERKWRWKDPQGKVWILRQTPFSIIRTEESELEAAAAEESGKAAQASTAQVFEEGEQLRFVTKTPFGKNEYRKKKTELTPEEREAWERSKAQAARPSR